MSLKSRLRISIFALVTVVVIASSLLNLHGIVGETLGDYRERGALLARELAGIVANSLPTHASLNEVGQNPEIVKSFSRAVASDPSAVSSRLVHPGEEAGKPPILEAKGPAQGSASCLRVDEWNRLPLLTMVEQIIEEPRDLVLSAPVPGVPMSEMNVELRVAGAAVRAEIVPRLVQLGLVAILSLLFSGILAVLMSNVVTGSLEQIAQDIECISKGDSKDTSPRFESTELAALQDKLKMLGAQYKGAQSSVASLRLNIDQMIKSLQEAVLIFDADGILQMAGEPAERLLVRRREDLLGQAADQVFPAWTSPGAVIQSAVRLGVSVRDRPVTLERPNLPEARLILTVEIIENLQREKIGFVVSLRDADSRRQLESQLDISRRLAAISRLTSGVAHEIKNPLNAIALHLELLRTQLASTGSQPELDIIIREVARLDRAVKSFIQFSRPLQIQLMECDLSDIAQEAARVVSGDAVSRSIRLVHKSSCERPTILADRELCTRALANVLQNGVEATQGAGEVSVQIDKVFDDYVVSVVDRGEGMPPVIQDKIYNLYFTTKPDAAGVGLALTFLVVQLHNGNIDFSSETGKGTEFRLRFPAAPKAA